MLAYGTPEPIVKYQTAAGFPCLGRRKEENSQFNIAHWVTMTIFGSAEQIVTYQTAAGIPRLGRRKILSLMLHIRLLWQLVCPTAQQIAI